MSIFQSRPKPTEVFTPRSHDLNKRTYAERPALEKRLKRALEGHKYIIIHGESGNGKSWLYKKVFQEVGMPYHVLNLAKMHTDGSLNAIISSKAGELGIEFSSTLKKEFDVGLRPAGIGGGYRDTIEYKSIPLAPLELLSQEMSRQSSGRMSVLVLENFEQIVDDDKFVKEVASLVISADDEFVAQNNIKIMIVGVPTNIRDLISRTSSANTISNRVVEIPEVARLELAEARSIMSQGFETHLKLTCLIDKNALYRDISHKTDRIAQHVQELCLKIALNAIDNKDTITDTVVSDSEREWIEETLSADLAVVESHMNAQKTTVGRKNQVLFSLGSLEKEDFNHHDVEKAVRKIFVVDSGINLNIPQILAGFAKADSPLIRKARAKGSIYRFCSPKTRMVIRSRLKLDSGHNVVRKT